MMNVICTVCPKGCHLEVNLDTKEVSGNDCNRGRVYGINEVENPKRVITSTVKIENAIINKLPVKTSDAIGKHLNFEAMDIIKKITVTSPIKCGDIIVENFLETGVSLIATRSL